MANISDTKRALSDDEIVALYFDRDEKAIAESDNKYGTLILSICRGVLRDDFDAEECRNDILLRLWNRIPPVRPLSLGAFISKIARELAIGRYREKNAGRLVPRALTASLDEIEEVIPSSTGVEEEADARSLSQAINRFLAHEHRKSRLIFVYRYFYNEPVDRIAENLGMGERAVYRELNRLKERLKTALESEGYVF